MTSGRIVVVCGLLLVVLSLTLINKYWESQDTKRRAYLEQALVEAEANETVFIDNTKIMVDGVHIVSTRPLEEGEDTEAMRLAHAALMLRRSPPFALSGISLERLNTTIQRLEIVREDIAQTQDEVDHGQHVRDDVFPIASLKELSELEHLRRTFLEHPDQNTLSAYSERLKKSVRVYEDDLEDYTRLYEDVFLPEAFSHATVPGDVSATTTLELLRSVMASVQDQHNVTRAYVACLEKLQLCNDSWTRLEAPSTIALDKEYPPPSSRTTDAAFSLLTRTIGGKSLHEGVRVRIPSVCVIQKNAPFLYLVPRYDELERSPRPIRELEDIFFVVLDADEEYRSRRSLDPFLMTGAQYLYYPLINPQGCNETQRDVSRAVGAARLYSLLERATPERLTSVVQGVGNRSYINGNTLTMVVERLLAEEKNPLTTADMHVLEEILLGLKYETTALDMQLAFFANVREDQLRARQHEGGAPINLPFLLAGWDNAYSTLLLFHPSANPNGLLLADHDPNFSSTTSSRIQSLSKLPPTEMDDLACGIMIVLEFHRGNTPSIESCS